MLHAALTGNGAAAVTQAISGLGGIGKTALAVEYAYHYAAEYPHVFLANASSTTALASGYRDIGKALGLPQADGKDLNEAVAAVVRWLTDNTGYLLILDNADFTEEYKEKDLLPYLPAQVRGHILITTRSNILSGAMGVKPNHMLRIGVMASDDALKFLTERIYGERAALTGDETAAVHDLAEKLGYLPLALEQAASYIAVNESTFRTYLTLYNWEEIRHLEKAAPETGDYEKTVAVTWEINFAEVEKVSKAAADLLTLSAFLAPEAIPLEVVYGAAQEVIPSIQRFCEGVNDETALARYDELLAPLTRYSLVTKNISQHVFSIHRLVQAVIRHRLNAVENESWVSTAVSVIIESFPGSDFTVWPLADRVLNHAITVLEHVQVAKIVSEQVAGLLNNIGYYLLQRGFYLQAKGLFAEARLMWGLIQSVDELEVATVLNNLAHANELEGNYDEAKNLLDEALEIRCRKLSEGHPAVAEILDNIGVLLQSQQLYNDALPYNERAFAIYNAFMNEDIDSTDARIIGCATSCNNLANVFSAIGRLAEAEELYEKSLSLTRKVAPNDYPKILIGLNNAALLKKRLLKYEESEKLYKEYFITAMTFMPNRPLDFGQFCHNFAQLYNVMGRYEDAEVLYHEAVDILEQDFGANHPNTNAAKRTLGGFYFERFLDEAYAAGEVSSPMLSDLEDLPPQEMQKVQGAFRRYLEQKEKNSVKDEEG